MKPDFLGPLELRQAAGGTWITLRPLLYRSARADMVITVAAEFITDLASVPRIPFVYMLAGGRARGPAVVHDWLYQHPDWEDRALADAILREAMAVDHPELGFEPEPAWVRGLIWAGVRVGGWVAWRGYRTRGIRLNPEWTAAGAWPAQQETP